MPQTLVIESPLVFPTPIAVPSDSDSPLASGQLKTCLKDLADRTDHLNARTYLVNSYQVDKSTAALIDTCTAPTATWKYVTAVQVLADVKAGDLLEVRATYLLKSAGAGDVRARLIYDGTGIASTTQICSGTELRVTFAYLIVVPSDDVSVTISIEIVPDGADDAELYGFGHTTIMQYRAGA